MSPLRTLLSIETSEPSLEAQPAIQPCLDFISSTAAVDRYHEIIDPVGWRLESYRQNPVFQNAHQYGDILFTLGKALITEVRGNPAGPSDTPQTALRNPHLFQRIQFATDVNPIARIAYGLYRGKFLNAVSVGFIPIRWEDTPSVPRPSNSTSAAAESLCLTKESTVLCGPPRPSDGRGVRGEGRSEGRGDGAVIRRKYLEQELLEVSAVAIPANPEALALGLKSGVVTKPDLSETLELLRSLLAASHPHHSTTPSLHYSTSASLHYSNSYMAFARELHRILRCA